MSEDQVAILMPEYLAMSQAFSYLQAESQRDLIFDAMHHNRDRARDIELTSMVANFNCWDERGGYRRVPQGGKAALPDIPVIENFHSNLFRKNASRLLGRAVRTNYSATTKRCLYSLYAGLSSKDPLVGCAYMVGFELHAADMIQSRRTTLVKTFEARSDDLENFRSHVRGEDPAEKYHREMTSRLLGELVLADFNGRFLNEFDRAYRLSLLWCRDLLRIVSREGDGHSEIEHHGRCHCGSVKFCVRAPRELLQFDAIAQSAKCLDFCTCSYLAIGSALSAAKNSSLRTSSTRTSLGTRFAGFVAQSHSVGRSRTLPDSAVNIRCLDNRMHKNKRVRWRALGASIPLYAPGPGSPASKIEALE
ncbi:MULTISPECIES: GFA family protein [unclassified Bradyrhizobium]|uniref:GFA family protein n=1 Tax=unclassified Bradyrhizobium TaxID=2631580 RepID=UPI002302D966|nr:MULTISPECIES: GFA family protein [unclassified Bradyrhizobium]